MADETCSWRGWRTTVQWSPTIAADVRDRLSAFLDLVLGQMDTLAASCAAADTVALIGALCAYAQHLDPADLVNELIEDVYAQAMDVANEAEVRAWTAIITDRLEAAALPVRWAVAGLLLQRVLCASSVSRVEAFDPQVIETAADDLERAVQSLLRAVLADRVSASTYRRM
jgi:hypothetical protein